MTRRVWPQEYRDAAKSGLIAGLADPRCKHPYRHARKAVGCVPQDTINQWCANWESDPDVLAAVKRREKAILDIVTGIALHATECAAKMIDDVGLDPKVRVQAQKNAISALGVFSRAHSEQHNTATSIVINGEVTPQTAARLVEQHFGKVSPAPILLPVIDVAVEPASAASPVTPVEPPPQS